MHKNERGKRRPVIPGPDGTRMPVMWVSGIEPYEGKWQTLDHDRATEVENEHLCLVCGLHRGDNWVYALLRGQPLDHRSFWFSPSATYGHPSCILKAVLFCPHLKAQEYPAMKQDKVTRLSVDDLKELARLEKQNESIQIGIGTYDRDRK